MTLPEVNAALTTLSVAVPQFAAAYGILKVIWMRTNPGKTEADYLAYLQTSAQANIDDTSALLIADGFVQAADGSWKKA